MKGSKVSDGARRIVIGVVAENGLILGLFTCWLIADVDL